MMHSNTSDVSLPFLFVAFSFKWKQSFTFVCGIAITFMT